MGRKKLEPEEKKTLLRVYVKKRILDNFSKKEITDKVNEFVKQLEK
jgi:hypothetical protein